MTVIEIIDHWIAVLQSSIDEQRKKTLTFIPNFGECQRVYRLIEDLELQVRTLENLAAVIIHRQKGGRTV